MTSGVNAGPAQATGTVSPRNFHDGAKASLLSPDAVKRRIEAADILLLGEVHDNPHHHAGQAQAMNWLFSTVLPDAPRPVVVFEMLDRGQQIELDVYTGDAENFGEAMGWAARGWPDSALYMPIFNAAFAAEARLVAGDLRKSVLRGLYDLGPDILPPDIRRVYDLLEPLDGDWRDDMADIQFHAHCGLIPRSRMAGMVTVQRARDAALAEAVIQSREDEPAAPVVLIAGAGHIRLDHGTGALLRRALPETDILAIGFVEATAWDGTALPEFDIVWTTPGVDRPDPCDSLRVRSKP